MGFQSEARSAHHPIMRLKLNRSRCHCLFFVPWYLTMPGSPPLPDLQTAHHIFFAEGGGRTAHTSGCVTSLSNKPPHTDAPPVFRMTTPAVPTMSQRSGRARDVAEHVSVRP